MIVVGRPLCSGGR